MGWFFIGGDLTSAKERNAAETVYNLLHVPVGVGFPGPVKLPFIGTSCKGYYWSGKCKRIGF